LDNQREHTISREAPIIGNATKSGEEPDQSWYARKNRFEAGPTERQINRGYRQEYPHQQLNSPLRNQGATGRRQSWQSTINNKIIARAFLLELLIVALWFGKPQTYSVSCSIQNPLNNGTNKNVHMTQLFAKCPKCGTETKAKRSTRWRMCAEGDCESCGVHFTTAAFWQSK
jgi:hypothetical protein